MAGLQLRGGSYRAIFRYGGQQRSVTLGRVPEQEARGKAGAIDLLLLRLKQGLIALPAGVSIEEFLLSEGRATPPAAAAPAAGGPVPFSRLKDEYLAARSGGSMEPGSLATASMHLRHFERSLGAGFDLRKLRLADLQGHIDRRRREGDPRRKGAAKRPIAAATLRLEVATFRAAWNWAVPGGLLGGPFPSRGLHYPKADERPPFMTRDEVERRLLAGGDPAELWDCLFLRKGEIVDLLEHIKRNATAPWLYPMVATAAWTGARRSELLRMEVADVDLDGATLLVRERKRSRHQRTTRSVALAPALRAVLREWLAAHPGGKFLFCQAGVVACSKKRGRTTGHRGGQARESSLKGRMSGVRRRDEQPAAAVTRDEAHDHLKRTLAGGRWAVLRGYHTLRHTFISCLAAEGVDQRVIDGFVGHSTEQQRRRYRHLYPELKQQAVATVFG